MKNWIGLTVLVAMTLTACGGGGESAPTTAAEPLPLTQTHEWSYADVRLPAAWSVTRDLPGGFQVASQPGLSPGFGLESGQVTVTSNQKAGCEEKGGDHGHLAHQEGFTHEMPATANHPPGA